MALNQKTKDLFSMLLRIGLSGALLTYLFSKIDTAKMLSIVKSADARYIFVAAAIFIVINGILLVRWQIFIRALGLAVPFKKIYEFKRIIREYGKTKFRRIRSRSET